jgi:hypothetical protein
MPFDPSPTNSARQELHRNERLASLLLISECEYSFHTAFAGSVAVSYDTQTTTLKILPSKLKQYE